MNRRMIALLLAAVLVLALTGCAKKEHSEGNPKTDLLATTQPVYQLTCALTDGTGLSVGLLISESVSCLHDYTLTVSQMEMIEQSGLVLESGLGWRISWKMCCAGKRASTFRGIWIHCPEKTAQIRTGGSTPCAISRRQSLPRRSWARSIRSLPTRFPKTSPAFCEKLSSLPGLR